MTTCLYEGEVWHRRRRPRVHEFRYGVTLCLLDLDEIPALDSSLRLFSANRRGIVSFWDRDHMDGRDGSTKAKLLQWLRGEGVELERPRIRLLTQCRVLGYVFNPISFYFCHERDEPVPRVVVAEVNNTFGGRHLYTLRADCRMPSESTAPAGATLRFSATKLMHVSPFVSMDARYDFRIKPIGERLSVTILEREHGDPLLDARLAGERRAFTDAMLGRMLVRYPFLTVKVISAIHWQALRLALKGLAFHRSPPASAEHAAQRARLEEPLR